MDNRLLLIFVGSIVLTSGCLGFNGFFGSTSGPVVVGQNDILLITGKQVIPSGSIPADSVFDVSFQVQNTGGAQTGKEATGVRVLGTDWGRCSPIDPETNQPYSPIPSSIEGIPGQGTDGVTIFPGGGSRLVEWEFKAPSNDRLGGVRGICPIRFKVEYDFNAFTVADFTVINEDRLRELNRAGQSPSAAGGQSRSEGPLKIDIQIDSPQPIRTGSSVPLRISVDNAGSGIFNEIPSGALSITFPDEVQAIQCDDRMSTSGSTRTNTKAIQLIRRSTPPIRCDITVPGADEVIDVRTFTLDAKLDYMYTLFDEVDVAVKPTFGITSTTDEGGTPGTTGPSGGFGDDEGGTPSTTGPSGGF